jgi:hypothetical protein
MGIQLAPNEKIIVVKLTKAGSRTGPFSVHDNYGNVLSEKVSKKDLISGISYKVDKKVSVVIIKSLGGCVGKCVSEIRVSVLQYDTVELATIGFENKNTASLWRHLTDPVLYNHFYGNIEPYIIEYPFAYQFQDEILQNVKDYTKAYKYLSNTDGVWNDNARVETDDRWFNKAVLYNGQQSSGILELVPKPMNNLKEYMKYPIYNPNSKVITYTKSDNFYQYNTFWSLVKNKSVPLFITDCCSSMSVDKIVNQSNMDYGKRSFKKEPLRAKELKVRHILDNRSDAHLVSQFITAPAQISYK